MAATIRIHDSVTTTWSHRKVLNVSEWHKPEVTGRRRRRSASSSDADGSIHLLQKSRKQRCPMIPICSGLRLQIQRPILPNQRKVAICKLAEPRALQNRRLPPALHAFQLRDIQSLEVAPALRRDAPANRARLGIVPHKTLMRSTLPAMLCECASPLQRKQRAIKRLQRLCN